MDDINKTFQKAAENVKKLTTRPSDKVLLELYGLYKQSTIGNINTPQPWAIQVEQRSKWDAWKSYENMEKNLAMTRYIIIANRLLEKK